MLLLGLAVHVCLLISTSHAKIGYFWHITDIHYDVHYSTSGDTRKNCWRHDGGMGGARRPAGKFGDYNCDSPWALVASAARAMKSKHGDNIEFVLWTGDGVAHSGGRTSEHQLSVLQNLTDLLRHTFSSQFVFPVLGHEDPPPGLGNQGYGEVADLWRAWLPTDAIHTFVKGGYYTFEQKVRKLRIVALNTNLFTEAGGKEEDPAGQWGWLEGVLDKSRRNRETVYIVGHIPPGVDERQSGGFLALHSAYQERFNRRYLRLVRKYSDIIVGQFFGHLHSDTFRIVYTENDRPVSWMFIAPAVSPRRTQSGANNPGLRLYKFETDTGQVLDYVQYYLDLATANQRDQADWQPEYNLTNYYELNEVTPLSLHNLAESFTNSEGAPLFARYYRANSVRLHQGPGVGGCDASCAHTHYCAITHLDDPEFRSCLDTEPSAFASDAGLPTVGLTFWSSLITILSMTVLRNS